METITRDARGAEKETRTSRCMNCGKEIERGTDIYSRRFCSEDCRAEYLEI